MEEKKEKRPADYGDSGKGESKGGIKRIFDSLRRKFPSFSNRGDTGELTQEEYNSLMEMIDNWGEEDASKK